MVVQWRSREINPIRYTMVQIPLATQICAIAFGSFESPGKGLSVGDIPPPGVRYVSSLIDSGLTFFRKKKKIDCSTYLLHGFSSFINTISATRVPYSATI